MTTVLTLMVGMVFGFLAQRSRFCMIAPIRNFFLTHDWQVWEGVLSLFSTAYFLYSVAGYLGWTHWASPRLSPGLLPTLVPVIAGAFGIGLVSMLVGNCPARQHVIAAQGDQGALFYLLGFYMSFFMFHVLNKVFGLLF